MVYHIPKTLYPIHLVANRKNPLTQNNNHPLTQNNNQPVLFYRGQHRLIVIY